MEALSLGVHIPLVCFGTRRADPLALISPV
jgi:hypothetical protein